MPTLAAGSVDAIIADLPYSATRFDWDKSLPLDHLWAEFSRVLKPTGAVVLTASQPFTAELVMSNLEWFKYALVWQKSRPTGFLQSKHMFLKSHEDILVFSPGVVMGRHRSTRQMTYNPQGLRPLERPQQRRNSSTQKTFVGQACGYPTVQTHTGYPTSVLRFSSVAKASHPTEKPLDLMRYLIRTFTNPGDTVLDCTMGVGTTGVAAMAEERRFVGIEREERFFKICQQRLAAL
jgi:site-specific DNA-methyltransferase (adenine-specific)